jgi:hypothetical protein
MSTVLNGIVLASLIPSGTTLLDLLVILLGLIILWIIVSIPVYVAGKIITSGRSTLGEAMAATLLGPIVYVIVLAAVDFLLGEIIGAGAYLWAFILAFIAWIGVYKSTFKTGWLGALAIAILAIIVFAVIGLIITALFGSTPLKPFFQSV